jgi:hypothetical protein
VFSCMTKYEIRVAGTHDERQRVPSSLVRGYGMRNLVAWRRRFSHSLS